MEQQIQVIQIPQEVPDPSILKPHDKRHDQVSYPNQTTEEYPLVPKLVIIAIVVFPIQ